MGLTVGGDQDRTRLRTPSATFCPYVWHFTGPGTAQRWTAAHPGTFVISLGDAAERASRLDLCLPALSLTG